MSTLMRLLQWSHEDLNDPAIRADAGRLKLERATAVRRLEPYIEQVVELAYRQLEAQKVESPELSARSKP